MGCFSKKNCEVWLKSYDKSNFLLIKKVWFLFYLNIAIVVALLSLIALRLGVFAITNNIHQYEIATLITLILVIIIFQVLLTKGYYNIVAHLVPLSIFVSMWFVFFTQDTSLLIRFSSPINTFVVLSILPLLINERKVYLWIYPSLNIITVTIFLIVFSKEYGLNQTEIAHYFTDMVFSIIFIAFIGYSIFNINSSALKEANKDLLLRKAAEKKLKEHEQRYKKLSETSPQIIYEIDLKGNILFVNDSGLKEFGYSADEIYNLNIKDVIVEKEILKQNIQQVLNLEMFEYQYTGIRKNGEHFYFLSYSNPYQKRGELVGIRGVAINITDKIIAQKELLESEKKYRDLANLLPITIYEAGSDKIISYTNKAAYKMFGYSEDEINGKISIIEVITPEDRDKARVNIKNLINSGEPSFHKYRAIKKDGSTFPIQVISNIIYENDKIVGFRGAIIDLTEIKEANQKLRESEALFRTVVDMVPYTINIADANRKNIFVNQAFLKKYHLTNEKALSTSIEGLGFKMDEASQKKVNNTLSLGKSIKNIQVKITTPSNQILHVLLSVEPILLNNQRHILSTIADITDKVNLENQLRDYNEKLEITVQERTEELAVSNEELSVANNYLFEQRKELENTLLELKQAQEKLIQTEKMASLGILTAGVAHEINNPMNYICNGLQVIKNHFQEKFPEEFLELEAFFNAIDEGVARTTNIVKSLNKYSRKDADEKLAVDIHQVIDNCLTMLFGKYKNRIDIKKKYGTDIPVLFGYETKLHQAFLNILDNAVQAIKDKGTIIIATKLKDNNIEILIQDTGNGINQKDLNHIFDPFFTTKSPGKGTGLGLSITNEIINEHGGNISCSSVFGEGSTFNILLPIKNQ